MIHHPIKKISEWFFLVIGFSILTSEVVTSSIRDAPFSLNENVYREAITCPRGISNQTGGVVFLIHGTGTTGEEVWSWSPYNEQLGRTAPGYDICWVTLPSKAVGDLQLAAEYVAYGIPYLASLSPKSGNRINLIGHSQGAGANVQWALTFWPSIQKSIINFFSLAGPFKGTIESSLVRIFETFMGGSLPGILQLSPKSNYMAAQNSGADRYSGARALVETTSIYSRYDEVVQWEGFRGHVSSYLEGATMVELQDQRLCGKSHIVGHMGMLIDPAAFSVVKELISNGRQRDLDSIDFDKSSCHHQEATWKNILLHWRIVVRVTKAFLWGASRVAMVMNEYRHLVSHESDSIDKPPS